MLERDSPHRKGGKYWVNGNYSVGLRVKSGGYEGVKERLLQNGPAVMGVVTRGVHTVAVFLRCPGASGGIPTCLNLNSFPTGPRVMLPKCSHFSKLSPEELERRRIRRERNKMAAAKCRNRRRELTETLQNVSERHAHERSTSGSKRPLTCIYSALQETDQLEDEKSRLQKEIAALQKEKDKLELVLEAHRPICKLGDSDSDSDSVPTISSLGIKMEREDPEVPGPSATLPAKVEKPKPKITIPSKPVTSSSSALNSESESLHTPVLISTPSLTPFTVGMIFTYPSAPTETSASHSSSQQGGSSQPHAHEPCGIAHRRSSSSGDQSDHSLHSPTILSL